MLFESLFIAVNTDNCVGAELFAMANCTVLAAVACSQIMAQWIVAVVLAATDGSEIPMEENVVLATL
jgi:hypothetical protein